MDSFNSPRLKSELGPYREGGGGRGSSESSLQLRSFLISGFSKAGEVQKSGLSESFIISVESLETISLVENISIKTRISC